MKVYRAKFKDYFNQLSLKTPAPGGGSAVCVVFCLGVALIEMAMHYSLSQGKSDISKLTKLRQRVYPYIDLDSKIFNKIMKAPSVKRPALVAESEKIVVDLGKACHQAYLIARRRRSEIKKSIISDFYIGLDCLKVALKGCLLNLEANQQSFGRKSSYSGVFRRYLKQWQKS